MKRPFSDKKPAKKFSGKDDRKAPYSDRGQWKPASHKAKCATCKKECEVPFKPNGKKPVLCKECFQKEGGAYPDKPWEKKEGAFQQAKPMFTAVCDRCEEKCSVPFRPIPGKPVYCPSCLGHGTQPTRKEAAQLNEQFQALNQKLDAILKLLGGAKE